MFFRNLTLFRFPASLRDALADLQPALAEHVLKPVGPLEMFSRGFVSPFGRDHEALSHRVDDAVWIVLGGEDKILPSAVVNEMAAKKAEEIEEREGRPLGGRARKRLKEDTLHELLPRAFSKPSRTGLHLDLNSGIAAVDTSSRKTAEGVLSELRTALGSFPAVPVNAEVAPRSVLSGWLAGEPLPKGLSLGDECELKDPVDRGAVVKAQRQELTAEEIVLGRALRGLAAKLKMKRPPIPGVEGMGKLLRPPAEARPYLERMGLDRPATMREKILQRAVVWALVSDGTL